MAQPLCLRPLRGRGGRRRPVSLTLLALLALPLVGGAGGCSLFRTIGVLSQRDPTTKAIYAPPKEQPLLVLVETREQSGLTQETADRLALFVEKELRDHEVAPLVSGLKVMELRQSRPEEHDAMSPARRGHFAGAKQVLHVVLTESQTRDIIASGRSTRLVARVKVLDATTGEVRWPSDPMGHEVAYSTPMENLEAPLVGLAVEIGKLFYEYAR